MREKRYFDQTEKKNSKWVYYSVTEAHWLHNGHRPRRWAPFSNCRVATSQPQHFFL